MNTKKKWTYKSKERKTRQVFLKKIAFYYILEQVFWCYVYVYTADIAKSNSYQKFPAHNETSRRFFLTNYSSKKVLSSQSETKFHQLWMCDGEDGERKKS